MGSEAFARAAACSPRAATNGATKTSLLLKLTTSLPTTDFGRARRVKLGQPSSADPQRRHVSATLRGWQCQPKRIRIAPELQLAATDQVDAFDDRFGQRTASQRRDRALALRPIEEDGVERVA